MTQKSNKKSAKKSSNKTAKRKRVGGLVLFHGAGGDRDHHTFLALEAELDLPVHRVNFPYRKKTPKRGFPDRMPKLLEAVNEAVSEASEMWDVGSKNLVVGGRSMGGRAASIAVAEGMKVAGLLLLSYPLHPPKKPDQLRVDHFDAISCPVLLVQGNRDPFGTPDEFAQHLPQIPTEVTEVWLDANHSPKKFDDDIVAHTQAWIAEL